MRKNKIFNVDTTKFKAMQLKDSPEFYSRDTDAFLTFTVPDESFEFDNALLYLINIDDGSVITEIETEILGQANVEYEIPSEIMAHYGRWKGQIVFQKDGEKASSAIFDFIIKRFLTDERPPTLNEVESIAKLRREAKELIAELSDTYDDLLVNGVLQTNINNKLTELETQYYPKLTEVAAQLAQTETYSNFADLLISGQVSKIKLIGDSITWGADGTGYTSGSSGKLIYYSYYEMNHNTDCWANSFRNYLSELYPSVDLFNAGISGHSMKDASRDKVQWIGTGNDVIILSLGINDGSKSESIDAFETYMQDVVNYCLANSNHLFIANTPPVKKSDNIGVNGHSIEMINSSIRKIAHLNNIPLLDINSETIYYANQLDVPFKTGGYFYDDDTHPSSDGHKMLWLAYQKELGFKDKQADFMRTSANGDEIIESVAINDPWVTRTFAPPFVYLKGSQVHLQLSFTGIVPSSTTDNVLIATLGTRYRPKRQIILLAFTLEGIKRVYINTNGKVYINKATEGFDNDISIAGTYPII